jgi:ADP-ribose pyrophosphatase
MSPRREYPVHPFVGVGILIEDDGRFLLIKRAAKPDQGLWTVPGGLVEVGERATDAAMREVLEETGLVVEIGERLGVVDKIEHDESGKVLYHFVILFYKATLTGGVLAAMDDALDARWVTIAEFKEYKITESLTRILREIRLLS